MKDFFELHRSLAENPIMVHQGELNQTIIKSLLAQMEGLLDKVEGASMTKRKIFNVMTEGLQNIDKHGDWQHIKDSLNYEPIFMLGKGDHEFIVTTGNLVKKDKVTNLKNAIDHLTSLDKDGLKALYKQAIKGAIISEEGGAGLGFIDMARKTGGKLSCYFEPVNDEYVYFSLKSVVEKNEVKSVA